MFILSAIPVPFVDGISTTVSYAGYDTLHPDAILLQKQSDEF
jgi:hypothetical protein